MVNLMDAFIRANELAARDEKAEITINLTAGTHYVISQRYSEMYRRLYKNEEDRKYTLHLKPL